MISQLTDNPIGRVLAAVSAGLLALLLLLAVIWVLPPSGAAGGDGDGNRDPSSEVPQLKTGQPIENYAVITDRPVFNESRQPIIGVSPEDESEDEELAGDEDVDAPDVVLAGVVITPELRVATLRLKDSPESLLAFEGQPLEGDFGSWHISRIEPRQAILESGAGEQVRLELQIHDAMMDTPPEPERAAAPGDHAQNTLDDGQPMTRAEEIRQRIAERREELKRAAEEGGEQPGQPPQLNYRQAIQAMMQQGNKNQETDESEQ
ncbi:MAG: hypothetical protein V2I48_03615 [Xanthomonadales bacterium]|jgi:hypothetical protein|nr:hypothetical protein [Xanthomonadales bacterium]